MRFTTLHLCIAVIVPAALAVPAAAEPALYELDPAHTTIAFLVEHAGYAKTLGQFLRVSGGYTFDDATGELSVLGTRRPLTLEATVNKSAPYPFGDRVDVMGVSARGMLKRSEFGMTYGVADNLVGDDVEIVIELEARRRPESRP